MTHLGHAVFGLVFAIGVFTSVYAEGQAHNQPGSGLEQRVASLEKRLSALEGALQPSSIDVNCGAGETVGAALTLAAHRPGLIVITISGTCRESVFLGQSNIRLLGAAAGAGLTAPSPTDTVLTLARDLHNISIGQLTLSGGSRGLQVGIGTDVLVAGSVVTRNTGPGIEVLGGSSVVLTDTTVTSNGFPGITMEASLTRITGGLIADNGGPGIMIGRGSARLRNVHVTGNSGPGVAVRASDLNVDGLIEANLGDGITAVHGSVVNFGSGRTLIENNSRHGLALRDTSIGRVRPEIEILGNGGWGVFCSPSPAVAYILVSGSFETVNGNRAGEVSCPSSPDTSGPF